MAIDNPTDISSGNSFLLGTDVKIVQNQFNILEIETLNGDLVATTNKENIIQAITRRLYSEMNELILHSDYGGFLSEYVSSLTTLEHINFVLILLKQEILKDPRIVSVPSINYTIDKTTRTLEFTFSALLIDQQVINNIVFSLVLN